METFYGCGDSDTVSGLRSSFFSFSKMTADKTAASTDVPAKFSQMPVSPSGQKTRIKITGKTRAVDTDMREAGSGFSMASM